MTYRARRASARYLDGDCPAGVLAILDNGGTDRPGGTFDRYTVLYVPDAADPWTVPYLGASEHPFAAQGFGQHGELTAWDARAYRRRCYRQSARWTDLPADVRRAVLQDLATADTGALVDA